MGRFCRAIQGPPWSRGRFDIAHEGTTHAHAPTLLRIRGLAHPLTLYGQDGVPDFFVNSAVVAYCLQVYNMEPQGPVGPWGGGAFDEVY
mgnify:CR=1 FL=1